MKKEPRTVCRTPTPDKKPTSIPSWKFDLRSNEILSIVDEAGSEGFLFSKLSDTIAARLEADDLSRLGSVGWHVTTVRLELEVRGDLSRVPDASPQRLVLNRKCAD